MNGNRKNHIKKKNSGFTLAELLIVVAIIAVLIAIGIPIFNGQLENARNRTDAYNAKVMGEAIKIYYMNDPDRIADLEQACKSAPRGYIQISVGPSNAAINSTLVPAISEAGLLPDLTSTAGRYNLTTESKKKWVGYYVAVAGPVDSMPGVVRVAYAGIPVGGEGSVHSYRNPNYYWPTNKDTTGFNDYVHGRD